MPVSSRLATAAASTTELTNDWHGIVEPLTVWEAKQSPQWEHWHAAMQAEWESHKKNNTWEYANLPAGRKAITCKWAFKLKAKPRDPKDPNSQDAIRYKARLMARGFIQILGKD